MCCVLYGWCPYKNSLRPFAEAMNKNRIVAYSLLAHINDNESGIRDLSDIFTPLFKRALSKMAAAGTVEAQLADLKQAVDKLYGFDTPFPFVRSILNRIAKEFERDDEVEFVVFKDGSFSSSRFAFTEFEDVVIRQEAEVDAVQASFEAYARQQRVDQESYPSVFDFLDRHRLKLSSFFAKGDMGTFSETDEALINYLQAVTENQEVFRVFRKIYIGSILSSYLTLDLKRDDQPTKRLEFVLDTNFLIGFLDLSTEASTHTCQKLVEVSQRLGYRLSVMDITLLETEGVFTRYADYWGQNYYWEKSDPQSIYHACARRRLSQTDLQRIASTLEEEVQKREISIIYKTEKYQNMARNSKEYEIESQRESNPEGALHDITAVKYVQNKRAKPVAKFTNSVCWFVTHPRGRLYLRTLPEPGYLPEIITADDLLSILWLSSPRVKLKEAVDTALTHLIANTIADSFPSARMLGEFGRNIEKYAKNEIPNEDIVRISQATASRTVKNLGELNQLAKKSPGEFVIKLQEIAKHLSEEVEKKERERVELISRMEEDVQRRILEQEERLKRDYHKDVQRRILEQEDRLKRDHQAEVEKVRAEAVGPLESKTTEAMVAQKKAEGAERSGRALQRALARRDWLVFTLALMLGSAPIWTHSKWFSWPWLEQHPNKLLIQIATQLLLVFLLLNIPVRSKWLHWINIAVVIALVILSLAAAL